MSEYCMLSHVRLFETPWTVACQTPLSMGFPRQEYWSRLPFSSPRDLPDPEMEPMSPVAPALADDSLPLVFFVIKLSVFANSHPLKLDSLTESRHTGLNLS